MSNGADGQAKGSGEPREPFGASAPLVDVEQLVRRAQRGDPVALEALIRELTPYLGRICGAIALDDGDDALQDTMLAVVRHLGSLREPLAIRGWARRIAVREARRRAHGGRTVSVDAGDLARVAAGDDPFEAADVRADVAAVLAMLSPEHRAVLVLRHLDGLSELEVAEVLDVAPGTVKSRTNRARATFRERWQ
jgi:RNA polymerase sigma-70 factor (ECF subfamily)